MPNLGRYLHGSLMKGEDLWLRSTEPNRRRPRTDCSPTNV